MSIAPQALERSVLEGKEREELAVIAEAMGVKPAPRASKATLIDSILRQAGIETGTEAPERPRRTRATKAAKPASAPAPEADSPVASGPEANGVSATDDASMAASTGEPGSNGEAGTNGDADGTRVSPSADADGGTDTGTVTATSATDATEATAAGETAARGAGPSLTASGTALNAWPTTRSMTWERVASRL